MSTVYLRNLVAKFDDGLWAVEDRKTGRWWTATSKNLDAHITNENLGLVRAESLLGTKIRFAIAAAEDGDLD